MGWRIFAGLAGIAIFEYFEYDNTGLKSEVVMVSQTLLSESTTVFPKDTNRGDLRDLAAVLENSQKSIDKEFEGIAGQKDFPVSTIRTPDGRIRPLTPELADVLIKVADQLSQGRAVLVAPCDTKLTTQDAADMTGVSRPTLINLLENGDIPFEKVGRHRRVLLSDLQKYAVNKHKEVISRFNDLARDADPSVMYDETEPLERISAAKKR